MEQFQIRQKVLTIRMPRELDHHSTQEIRMKADRLIAEKNINQVEFDFRNTEFMDSSGIGLVMGRYRLVREWGGTVEIHNPSPSIKKVMRLAGMDRIASIHSSPPAGGASCEKTEAKR